MQLTKEELKKIFITNRKLTQKDYHDLIDSLLSNMPSTDNADALHRHSITGISNLEAALELINDAIIINTSNIDKLKNKDTTIEKLSDQITSNNKFIFNTTEPFYVNSLKVVLNGLEQTKGDYYDYTILLNNNGDGISIVMSDEMPLIPADNLTVSYTSIL